MAFYAGKVIKHPAMANPTLVVLTDRNDLDDQFFGTFSLCQDLLRQQPVQVERRDQVEELLKVASGWVVFRLPVETSRATPSRKVNSSATVLASR